jgi:hypothetical protein
MTSLTNLSPAASYGDLLTTTNNGQGLTTTLKFVQDGLGNSSPMQIATNAVNFITTGGNSFQINGVPAFPAGGGSAWVIFDGTQAIGNNINIIANSGIASIDKTAVGEFTIHFTNGPGTFPTGNIGLAGATDSVSVVSKIESTATSINISTNDSMTGNSEDASFVSIQFFGS